MFFKKRKKDEDDEDESLDAAKPTREEKAQAKAELKAKKQAEKEARAEAKREAKENPPPKLSKEEKAQAKADAKAKKQAEKDIKAEAKKRAKEAAAKEPKADKKKGEKKSKTGKAGSVKPPKNKFLKGPRFVLFVGDEGTILLYLKGNVVLSRQFVPDASEQNLEELKTSLDKDTKAPLSIVIDSLDQTYVQQTLPPVSSMSVKKLMKRRLERDFGANDIKGSILLGRETTGRKDWNFLMVSIEKSRQMTLWLEFVYTLPNRFIGIYLVSVESEIILKNLDRAMGVPKGGTGSKWKFFVSHNKVGGFRQVILRDDRIIFTRMAQPIGESTPEVIAGNIEQEMQSTIEYMKRLSFDPGSGLDIYIIAGSAVKPVIDKSKFPGTNFTIMTPFEAAGYLGIEGATQPTDQFGDVILAATISASPKHILMLSTPESKKTDNLFMILKGQRIAAVLAMLGILGFAGSIVDDIYTLYEASSDLEDTERQHQQKLDSLRAEIKRSDLDVDKTGDIIELYQLLDQEKVSPLDFIAKAESVIALPVKVKAMEWNVDEKGFMTSPPAPAGAPPVKPKLQVVFTLEFPQVTTLEVWRVVSRKFLADMKAVFKGYDISFTRVPSQFTETEKMDLSFDAPAKAPVANDNNEVQLVMKEL